MGVDLMGELVANNGTYFLSSGFYEGNIDQIIVRGQGIIIAKIYVIRDGEEIGINSELLSNNAVPDGLRITPHNNEVFTRVEIEGVPTIGTGLELVLA